MDEKQHPNSPRYWRLNEIQGIRADFEGLGEPPATPEEKERREEASERLAALEARENAVQERYARIRASAVAQQVGPTGT